MSGPSRRQAWTVLAVALLVRLGPILWADRLTADVLMYHKVATRVLGGTWNPYTLHGLYPYPPVWIVFEAGSEWLAGRTGVGFPVLVKLPTLAADLAIVAVLFGWGAVGLRAAWLYALHPVSVLITGFHGQFDALMLLGVLLALRRLEDGRLDASALALAAAIAVKSVPVLLLPLLLVHVAEAARVRYVLLAALPVAALLLPFAIADFPALWRELLGYGGIADFGWIALVRGADWLRTGVLAKSEASHWGALIPTAKALFLAAYAAMVAGAWSGRLRWSAPRATLAVFLAFQVLYGAVSAQYLLWVVPLAVLAWDAYAALYSVAATAALAGFYAFLQPAVLQGDPPLVTYAPETAGRLWVAGVAAALAVGAAWLVALTRRAWARTWSAPRIT